MNHEIIIDKIPKRGILFKKNLISEIKSGRKTETRRLSGLKEVNMNPGMWEIVDGGKDERGRMTIAFRSKGIDQIVQCHCPYGKPGDYLYSKVNLYTSRQKANTWMVVKDILIQRIQNITDRECINEGIERSIHGYGYRVYGQQDRWTENPKESFRTLWDSINNGMNWDYNPWVWAVKFKLISKPNRI